jgi:hypothetical protein
LIYVIIAAGIMGGVLMFYAVQIDVRPEEAATLSNKLVDAISEDGYLKEGISEENILSAAGLEENSFHEMFDYYLNISFYGESVRNIHAGNRDFQVSCKLEGRHFPECHEKEVYLLDENGNEVRVKILTAANQEGREV